MAVQKPTTDHEVIQAWAEANDMMPVEMFPSLLDHEPSTMRMLHKMRLEVGSQFRVLLWPDFFSRFDLLGLTFVRDDDATGYCELLQIEDKSPYRNARYVATPLSN